MVQFELPRVSHFHLSSPSVYEILKENGYYVGHAGKWGIHLPFDKNIDFNVEDDGWHYRKIGKKLWHITEKNEADALRFLATRPKEKPFFLNVAFLSGISKTSFIFIPIYCGQPKSVGGVGET